MEECDENENELPPILQQIIGFLHNASDVVRGAITGKGVMAPRQVRRDRLRQCYDCEFFIPKSNRCGQCGCFMNTKVKFKQAECPVGKWGKIDD